MIQRTSSVLYRRGKARSSRAPTICKIKISLQRKLDVACFNVTGRLAMRIAFEGPSSRLSPKRRVDPPGGYCSLEGYATYAASNALLVCLHEVRPQTRICFDLAMYD